MPHLSEMHLIFLQRSSFWEVRRALIGHLSSALWLAEYLKRVMEMLHSFTCCYAVSQPFYSLWSRDATNIDFVGTIIV